MIGTCHFKLGDHALALETWQQVLAAQESLYDNEQPHAMQKNSWVKMSFGRCKLVDTLTIEYLVGCCHYELSDHKLALELWQRVLIGREKALGHEHPDTLEVAQRLEKCSEMDKTAIKCNASG